MLPQSLDGTIFDFPNFMAKGASNCNVLLERRPTTILKLGDDLRSTYTARITMRRGTSRCSASRQMLFFQFTLVKRCLIFLVTMASQQQDIFIALALQPQVNSLTCIAKQRKSDDFRF